MKKITYSDLDSGSEFNLKDGTLYIDDGRTLRMRVVYQTYNDNYNEYIEFVPNVLDSSVTNANNGDFNILIGDRPLRLANLNGNSTVFRVATDQIYAATPIVSNKSVIFEDSNEGIQFGNGDIIKKNPIKWTLIADRGLTDTAVNLPAGYATVADLLAGATEGMLVAKVGDEYVSTVIPAAAVIAYPASFPIHKGGSEVGSFTFTAATDTTFTVTVGSAENIKVFMR